MNRREAVIGLGALALAACMEPTAAPEILPPASINIFAVSLWANPRPEYGKVPGTQCPWQDPWAAMKKRDRIPLMGEYDERDPAVTIQRLKWMEYAGVHCVTYQIEVDHASLKAA